MKKYLLSIDGSTVGTGVSIFNIDTKELVDYQVFKKNSEEERDMRKRVIYMIDCISNYIKKYNPQKIVMEQVIPAINNASTVLALGILQGGILGLSHGFNIPIEFMDVPYWHSELNILKSNGDLKEQSIKWVNDKYNLNLIYKSPSSKYNQDNEADSICIGSVYLGNYIKTKKRKIGGK